MTHFMEKFFPSGLFVFELFPAEKKSSSDLAAV